MKKRASRTLHYSLTLSVSGSGTLDAGGVALKTRLPVGTVVQVTASPGVGATFSGWSGDATGSANPLTVTMDAAKAITATFTPTSSSQFALQVTANDTAGHVSGGGLDTTGTGSDTANFNSGTNVSLTATAKSGYSFANWTGSLTGQANPGSVVVDANKLVNAVFNATQPPPSGLYPTSTFWDPIAASPAVDTNSTNFIANFLSQGTWAAKPQGTEFTANDWTRPFYIAKLTDPTHTIQGGMNGSYTEPSIQGDTIHVPAGARPAGGALSQQLDGSCVIQQPDGKIYSAWRSVDPIDGRANQWAMIDGLGDGRPSGSQAGIGQAKFGPVQGQVRYDELVTAGVIPHALFMEVRNWHRRDWPGLLSGGGTGGYTTNTNAPPMGGHFQLNYTPTQINALTVPAWKKVILRAMATYGIYTYDNGSSAHSLDWESGIPSLLATGTNRWVTWAKSVGLPSHVDNTGHTIYTADIESGVDWSRLRVLTPVGP